MITKMMSYLSDEEAKEMGRWAGQNLVKDFLTFWFKEVSVTTLVKGYPALESKYGKSFEYEEHVDGGRWTIILKHGRGIKWSFYYEELLGPCSSNCSRRKSRLNGRKIRSLRDSAPSRPHLGAHRYWMIFFFGDSSSEFSYPAS